MGVSKVILNGVTRMDVTTDNPYEGNILKHVLVTGGDGGKVLGSVVTPYKLLAISDFTVNTTSTSSASVGTIDLGSAGYTSDKIIYVKIRDKAGPRNGYFTGSDVYFFNNYVVNGATTTVSGAMRVVHACDSSGKFVRNNYNSTTGYGVYAYSIDSAGVLTIYRRYNSSVSYTINGTYRVWVYSLEYVDPAGNPYDYSAI